MSFNKVIIVGHLGNDPELRYTPQGVAVTNFNIATNDKFGDKDNTTWFSVTVWRNNAEAVCKHLRKGSQAFIEGSLTTDTWVDKNGETKLTLRVSAQAIKFLNGVQHPPQVENDEEPEPEEPSAPKPTGKKPGRPKKQDDIPF